MLQLASAILSILQFISNLDNNPIISRRVVGRAPSKIINAVTSAYFQCLHNSVGGKDVFRPINVRTNYQSFDKLIVVQVVVLSRNFDSDYPALLSIPDE
ncbi:hypothetical protein N008_06795 [Hymenobacter sp. APR13]|nr:hypothetical protein N008_06795 [Hymenobacter sp. APR13]